MSTRREEIEKLLEETEVPLTAKEICDRLGISATSIVYEDLEHIRHSIKIKGKEILIRPATCEKCGYQFLDRQVAKRPSKCPKCHSEHLAQPAYIIRP